MKNSIKPLIAPSFLSADFGQLDKEIQLIEESEADWLHLDIMDGVFVPNISFGMPLVKHISGKSTKPLDVHLMIVQPERYLADFKSCGAGYLTVHYEACTHLHRTIQEIKNLGMKAGVALNPHSPVHLLRDVITDLDLVLIMSVNPGFGGQQFIPRTYHKINELKQMILESGSSALIEVDGGVNADNARFLLDAGADVLVAGNYIFKSYDIKQTISHLKQI